MSPARIRTLLARRHDPAQITEAGNELRAGAVTMAHSILAYETQINALTEALDLDAEIRRNPVTAPTLRPRLDALMTAMDPRLAAVFGIVEALRREVSGG